MLSLSAKTQSCTKRIQVLRRPLLCLIQLRESPGPTVDKFRLCPWLRLCRLHLPRRPYRSFFRRGSFRLGPAAAEQPLLASLGPPWIKVSPSRVLLHQPSRDEQRPRENRARLGAPRLARLRPGPPSTQFLLCRSNTPPTRPHLLRVYLLLSFQRRLGVSAPQPSSPRRHHRRTSSSSSLSSGTRTQIGRVNNASNRFVTSPPISSSRMSLGPHRRFPSSPLSLIHI